MMRVRRVLLVLSLITTMMWISSSPAHAYNCDGPNDPVCIALGVVCKVGSKVHLTAFCDLG